MANDSFNLFVSIFLSFSINGFKENIENFLLLLNSEKKTRALFVFVISPWIRKFFFFGRFLQMLSTAATIKVGVVYL